MFLSAIVRGVSAGILERSEYEDVITKARAGLTPTVLKNGTVTVRATASSATRRPTTSARLSTAAPAGRRRRRAVRGRRPRQGRLRAGGGLAVVGQFHIFAFALGSRSPASNFARPGSPARGCASSRLIVELGRARRLRSAGNHAARLPHPGQTHQSHAILAGPEEDGIWDVQGARLAGEAPESPHQRRLRIDDLRGTLRVWSQNGLRDDRQEALDRVSDLVVAFSPPPDDPAVVDEDGAGAADEADLLG